LCSGTYTTHKTIEELKAEFLGVERIGILGSNWACQAKSMKGESDGDLYYGM
jgi:hypothetical protein